MTMEYIDNIRSTSVDVTGICIKTNSLYRVYGAIYETPNAYKPPDENDLAGNTEYPNLNSRDYAKRPLNHNVRMHDAWECISINTKDNQQDGNVTIATNKLSGRNWFGSLWAFEKSDVKKNKSSVNASSSCFKLQCPSIINCTEFVEPNILLLALNSGKLQVWSTQSEVRNPKNPYCPFLIGEKCEHMKPITCLAGFETNVFKAITGSKDGALKVWDMGKADLFSIQSYRYAHLDIITGLASSPTDDSIVATCSLDKSCLLWDLREARPAIGLYTDYNVRFKNVCWALDPAENSIYLGDEAGYVLTIDVRKPKETLNEFKYFDRPIKKMSPNGANLAVIADSNIVKISKVATHTIFYQNNDSQNFIRDCVWLTPAELLTIGFESELRYHNIN